MIEEEEKKEQMLNDEEGEGINLFDYLIILAKWKKLILLITLPVAIILVVTSFLSKITFYEAQTTILPPQSRQTSFATQFMNRLGLGNLGGGRGGMIWNQRLLVEMIKSKTIIIKLAEKFNLRDQYETDDYNTIHKLFFENITIEPSYDNNFRLRNQSSPLIRISVVNQSPHKAAEIANAIVEELKIFVNNIAISEASKRRLFFEEQLKKVSENLIESEDNVRELQEKTGILKVDAQSKMTIEKIANLEAQMTAQEIHLQVIKSYSTANNPDVQKIEALIKGLKKELAKLEAPKNSGKSLLIPTGVMPVLGLEYKRILRTLKFNETLYEIMVKQYEAAKIDEAKNATIIQVIDKAVPPKKPSSMRRIGGKKALGATFLVFFLSCFLAFLMEFRDRSSKENKKNEKILALKHYLSFKKKK